MANATRPGRDATAPLLLGGLTAAFGLLTLGVAVFLSLAAPVRVTLACERASGKCARTQSQVTVGVGSLSSARHEPAEGGLRIVVDDGGRVVGLSNVATDETRQADQAAAITLMRAFAAGQEPVLSVSYPVGGGKPEARLWLGAVVGLLFGAWFLREGLRRRRVA